jgi:hypothetical protein
MFGDEAPFDAEAARHCGPVYAAVRARGRTPRRRLADLLIASVAIANELPLYTTNPSDFAGLEHLRWPSTRSPGRIDPLRGEHRGAALDVAVVRGEVPGPGAAQHHWG